MEMKRQTLLSTTNRQENGKCYFQVKIMHRYLECLGEITKSL